MTPIIDYCSFAPSYPVARYVLRMWSISFPATVIVGVLVMGFSSTKPAGHTAHAAVAAFSTVTLVPIIETLLLAATISVVSRFAREPNTVSIGSALIWAALHSLAWPPWGLIVAWSFYVMSRAYLAWRPLGFGTALFVVACIHAAHNLIPALAMLA
jgi:hypothetical protein